MFWKMAGASGLISTGGAATYLGRVVLAGYVLDDVPVVQAPRRTLEHWVVSVLRDGAGRYLDDAGPPVELRPGSVLVIPPGHPHWYGTIDNATWSETWAILDGPLFNLLESATRARGVVHPIRAGGNAAAIPALLRRPTRGHRAAEQQVTELFAALVDIVGTDDGPQLSPTIQAALELLSSDMTATLSMTDVAHQVGLDYDVFRHTFADEVGWSPSAFRDERRLQAAANMLRMTTMTHRAIARELGYTDEFHFSRRFRNAFGVPPSAYRRRK